MDNRQRDGQLEDSLYESFIGMQSGLWTAMPGYIVTFDPSAVTAEVQLTVKGIVRKADGSAESQDLPLLPDVPVCLPRGGGVTLTFPVKPGDECLVVFSSRCIDGWWQSGGVQLAPELRLHDINDGFAIIGPQSQPNTISGISTETAQLRSDDGAAHIEIHPTRHDINVVTPGNVAATVGGNVAEQVTGNVDMTVGGTVTGSASEWNITGPVNITGPLTVSGSISGGTGGGGDVTITGNVTATGDVTGAGVSLASHDHPGDSGGTTGAPN